MSEAIDRYLATVLTLSDRPGGATVTRLAKELRVAPSSVSQMLGRLATAGLLDRLPLGLRLTAEGRRRAVFLLRRHRLSECFLADVLGVPWHRVHEEASIFERALSPLVVARLAERLGHPATCPHGRPLPDDHGDSPAAATRPLLELAGGEAGVVACVDDIDAELLLRLESLGLVPSARLTIEKIVGDGHRLGCVDGVRQLLDQATLRHVSVGPCASGLTDMPRSPARVCA